MSHGFPGNGAFDRRLRANTTLNGAIALAEFAGGLFSGSLTLLLDAGHNLSDVAAVVLAPWARRFSQRPPTTRSRLRDPTGRASRPFSGS